MLDDIDKRLNSLLEEKQEEKQAVVEEKTYNLEEKIKEKLENCNAVLIFKKEDGSLEVNKSELINKDLFISIVANAILLVLLFTKIAGIW